MARAGDTLEHPVTGERIVFLKTARDTDGELLQLDFFMKPGGFVAAAHVHPHQEESVEVLSGSMRSRVRGQESIVGAGERIVVPDGAPHVWWNPGEEEGHVLVEFRPALRTETFFETFFGFAKDGKVNPKSGLANPLQMAVIARHYEDEVYLARVPLFVQRVLVGLLASIGELFGYKARYPKYSGPEDPQAREEGVRPSAPGTVSASIVVAIVLATLFALLLLWRRRVA